MNENRLSRIITYIFIILLSISIYSLMIIGKVLLSGYVKDDYLVGSLDKVIPILLCVPLIIVYSSKNSFKFNSEVFSIGLKKSYPSYIVGISFFIYYFIIAIIEIPVLPNYLTYIYCVLYSILYGFFVGFLFYGFSFNSLIEEANSKKERIGVIITITILLAIGQFSNFIVNPSYLFTNISYIICNALFGVYLGYIYLKYKNIYLVSTLFAIMTLCLNLSKLFLFKIYDLSWWGMLIYVACFMPLFIIGIFGIKKELDKEEVNDIYEV